MKKGMRLTPLLLVTAVMLLLAGSSCTKAIRPLGGMLSGRVYGYSMYDEAIPLVWARVSAYANGTLVESVSTGFNGSYAMFLPGGLLNVTVESPGFKPQARFVAISDGGSAQLNFYLERSEIPIPEFHTYLLSIVTVSLLVLTTALTRRKRR